MTLYRVTVTNDQTREERVVKLWRDTAVEAQVDALHMCFRLLEWRRASAAVPK